MMAKFARRALLAVAPALCAPAPLRAQPAATARMRMAWWGGAERARRTRAALDIWQSRNPGALIESETVGWSDYWTRLATQVAGGNSPDVIQMDYRYIHEYARRRALRPLDEFMPQPLDIADFGPANIDTGRVDGRVFGVSMGVNSTAMLYDTTVLERLNIAPPTPNTSWAQFAEIATAIARGVGRRGYFGTADAGLSEPAFEVFVRGRGRPLYGEDGKVAFTRDDAAEWFDYWDRLRRANVAAVGDVQATFRLTPETSMIVTGRAAMDFSHSNLLIAHQGLMQNKLGMTAFPRGAQPGQYLKPSMLLSVAATAANPREAARLVGFLSVDKAAGEALGVERGVPPSAARRGELATTVPEGDRIQIDYIAAIAGNVAARPPPPPRGAGEVANLLRRTNEQVAFGQLRVPQAAEQFVAECGRILERA
jgi:multiple sugar transport system substrate-binding protein